MVGALSSTYHLYDISRNLSFDRQRFMIRPFITRSDDARHSDDGGFPEVRRQLRGKTQYAADALDGVH